MTRIQTFSPRVVCTRSYCKFASFYSSALNRWVTEKDCDCPHNFDLINCSFDASESFKSLKFYQFSFTYFLIHSFSKPQTLFSTLFLFGLFHNICSLHCWCMACCCWSHEKQRKREALDVLAICDSWERKFHSIKKIFLKRSTLRSMEWIVALFSGFFSIPHCHHRMESSCVDGGHCLRHRAAALIAKEITKHSELEWTEHRRVMDDWKRMNDLESKNWKIWEKMKIYLAKNSGKFSHIHTTARSSSDITNTLKPKAARAESEPACWYMYTIMLLALLCCTKSLCMLLDSLFRNSFNDRFSMTMMISFPSHCSYTFCVFAFCCEKFSTINVLFIEWENKMEMAAVFLHYDSPTHETHFLA